MVGHLLDFRKGQLDEAGRAGEDTGVAELPVELFTVGGAAAPVSEELLAPAEPVGSGIES